MTIDSPPAPEPSIIERARAAAARAAATEQARIDQEIEQAERRLAARRAELMQKAAESDLKDILPGVELQRVAGGKDFVVVRPIDPPDDQLHFIVAPRPGNDRAPWQVHLADLNVLGTDRPGHLHHWLSGAYRVSSLAELGVAVDMLTARAAARSADAA